MKSPKSSGRPKKPRLLLVRRVSGDSMRPALRPGMLVIAISSSRRPKENDVVIVEHEGLEKIKRIQAIKGDMIYIVGDNMASSTDSRAFGWLDVGVVRAKLIWPRI
jgi:phage repressor protein C with HTH and peptisase S24 domain